MTFTSTYFDPATRSPSWTPTEANKIGGQLEVLEATRRDDNLLINGNFDVWQRGVTHTIPHNSAVYTADRWLVNNWTGNNLTVSRDTTVPDVNSKYVIKFTGTVNADGYIAPQQRIESGLAKRLGGKQVTVSFYLNASTSAGTIECLVGWQVPSAEDNFGTLEYSLFNHTIAVPAGYGLVSTTFDMPVTTPGNAYPLSNGAVLAFVFSQKTAPGVVTVYMSQVKLEVSDTASTFMPRTYAEELWDCMRYFQWIPSHGVGVAMGGASVARVGFKMQRAMRARPTATFGSDVRFFDGAASAAYTGIGGMYYYDNTTNIVEFDINVGVGLTNFRPAIAYLNSVNSYLTLDAEL